MMAPWTGLSRQEAAERLARYGPNRWTEARPLRFGSVLREELGEPMVLLLLAVGVGYLLLGELGEAVAVLAILAGILLIKVGTEYRAKRALRALAELTAPVARVVRDGQVEVVAAEQVVPGDLLLLRAGDRVAADGQLLWATELAADEAPLMGESVPVPKEPGATILGGTLVVRGEGLARVTATGAGTRLGRVASLARAARPPRTPLQLAMKSLSKSLAVVSLVVAALVPALLVTVGHRPWSEAVLTGLALAFATIPEELPILITLVLAIGALRLARTRALVRRLVAAETLGAVTVLVTDKTGTLTQNRLQVAAVDPVPPHDSGALLQAAGLSLGAAEEALAPALLVDPLERALLEAAPAGRDGRVLVQRLPYTAERGWSGAVWQRDGGAPVRFVKGAPEAVLPLVSGLDEGQREAVRRRAEALAAQGYRVLAVARDQQLLGLVGLADPLRPEAPGVVEAIRRAGVRVVIATGDHPAAAQAVARWLGLPEEPLWTGRQLDDLDEAGWRQVAREATVLARIHPEHKLRLVQALQAEGQVVAMTGDGVNDAPALRAAHIGIALGQSGSEAAREAADLVLGDDDLAAVRTALWEGRGLFANLQKAVRYYLAVKLGLVAALLLPALVGLPLPFSPIQIILLELFMDLAASTAFVVEPPEAELTTAPPRDPARPFLDGRMVKGIAVGGLALAGAVWGSVAGAGALDAGGAGEAGVRSVAFAAWMVGHVALAFALRGWQTPAWRLPLLSNPVLNRWALGALAATVAGLYLPPLPRLLGTAALPLRAWGWATVLPLVLAAVVAAAVAPAARAGQGRNRLIDREEKISEGQKRAV